MIVGALETCCREGELLTLQWADVSLSRGEILVRAEHTKDRENRIIPISDRLRKVLEMRRNSLAGLPFQPSTYVFGDEIGRRVRKVRRAWQTAVLRAHGHKPVALGESVACSVSLLVLRPSTAEPCRRWH